MVVLVINDHVLKSLAPGLLTGKLSDFAGLLLFPLLLVSIVELAALVLRRRPRDRRSLALCAIVASGLVFAVVKTTVAGSSALGWSVGLAQWLADAGLLRGDDVATSRARPLSAAGADQPLGGGRVPGPHGRSALGAEPRPRGAPA